MVGPSGPKMQPEGNKEEFMTEEQEMEEYEALKRYKAMKSGKRKK